MSEEARASAQPACTSKDLRVDAEFGACQSHRVWSALTESTTSSSCGRRLASTAGQRRQPGMGDGAGRMCSAFASIGCRGCRFGALGFGE
eukprot:2361646-Prymnesium_polylepis.1